MKKKKISPSSGVLYLILVCWALTTVYPIFWVIQNSFKTRTIILENSFSLPYGDLVTLLTATSTLMEQRSSSVGS